MRGFKLSISFRSAVYCFADKRTRREVLLRISRTGSYAIIQVEARSSSKSHFHSGFLLPAGLESGSDQSAWSRLLKLNLSFSNSCRTSHKEVADQDYLWTVKKIPPQPYMNEVYWPRSSAETPAFFRNSLVQFVARTYDLTRGNLDGSKSQAWAGGGWLAFRSGLIGDVFGVQAAVYTSQPIFAPI